MYCTEIYVQEQKRRQSVSVEWIVGKAGSNNGGDADDKCRNQGDIQQPIFTQVAR